MRRVVLLLVTILGVNASAEQAADWRFAHPDATFLAGVEWKRLAPELDGLLRQAGISSKESVTFLSRLERVSVSVSVNGNSADLLAMLEGDFTPADIRELGKAAGLQASQFGAMTGMASKGKLGLVALTPRHVLLGEDGGIKAAIKRLSEPASSIPLALQQAAPAFRSGDFWLIGSLPRGLGKALGEMLAGLNPVNKPSRARAAVAPRPIFGDARPAVAGTVRPAVGFPGFGAFTSPAAASTTERPGPMVIHGVEGGSRLVVMK